jgi:hypothetical protein
MNETKTVNGTPIKLISVTQQGWLFVEVVREAGGNYRCFVDPGNVIRPAACSEQFNALAFWRMTHDHTP